MVHVSHYAGRISVRLDSFHASSGPDPFPRENEELDPTSLTPLSLPFILAVHPMGLFFLLL